MCSCVITYPCFSVCVSDPQCVCMVFAVCGDNGVDRRVSLCIWCVFGPVCARYFANSRGVFEFLSREGGGADRGWPRGRWGQKKDTY